jgi:hypothetical protein
MTIQNYSLDQLLAYKKITIRSYNVLQSIGISCLKQIVNYYLENKDFRKIKNCGNKSNLELTELCESLFSDGDIIFTEEEDLIISNSKQEVWEKQDSLTKLTFEIYYKHKFNELSNRARNGLIGLETTYSRQTFIFSNFNFGSIRNIGAKCQSELYEFKENLLQYFDQLLLLDKRELTIHLLKNVLLHENKIGGTNENFDIEGLVDDAGEVKFFSFLDGYNKLFGLKTSLLTDIHALLFTNNGLTTTDIIAKHGITKERVRQLKIEHLNRIEKIYSFITLLPADWLLRYLTFDTKYFVCINETFADEINEKEGVNFNTSCYFNILKAFAPNSVFGLSNDNHSRNNCYVNENLGNSYLVKKNITTSFDFDVLFKMAKQIGEEKKPGTTKVDLTTLLSSCMKDVSDEAGIEMGKTILLNEFDFSINEQQQIEIKSDKKRVSDYCFEILDQSGYPLTIHEIYESLELKNDDRKKGIDNLRSTLLRYKDLFICFGRTSTYGLKKWEEEFEFVRGGSIRDMVSSFLEDKDHPCHISEITEHVQQFRRNTYDVSILRNLMLEESNTFIFYPSNFVGLSSKAYSAESIDITKVVGVHFTGKVLKKYNGMHIDQVIEEYRVKYGYSPRQTRSILDNKIQQGHLKLVNNILVF